MGILLRSTCRTRGREQGAVLPMFAMFLVLILAVMGLAIDASRLMNRKVELQTVADFAALSAAQKLTGDAAGIDAALEAAKTVFAMQNYDYGSTRYAWDDSAMAFSDKPDGDWLGIAGAKAAAGAVRYVQVDTRFLAAQTGEIHLYLARALNGQTTVTTSASAVAGASAVNLMPLAICAMSASPGSLRLPHGELVQYGFRRGVAYDLMRLNPDGPSPVNFVVNPMEPGDSPGGAGDVSVATVGPFVCSGTMPATWAPGGRVKVSPDFPIAALSPHLNSRFGMYSGNACDFRSAPPDRNVKQFPFNAAKSWMTTPPVGQAALSHTDASKLQTVADPVPAPGGTTANMYGQLWTYAKPVPFSEYVPGVPEPLSGYTTFAKSLLTHLYVPGKPEPNSYYPAGTPYMTGSTDFHVVPDPAYGKGLRDRRVLNVPLLACPVTGASAKVLAVGRFFMPVPATSSSLPGEFAGIVTGPSLFGEAELLK